MVGRYRKLLIGLAVAAFTTSVVYDLLRQRSPADLKGGFKEIAFARNEQNKGGIMRVYAFSVADIVDADFMGCGDLLPHNDYGSVTKAFFFASDKPAPPTIQLESPHFDVGQFHPVAVYLKDKDGIANVARFD